MKELNGKEIAEFVKARQLKQVRGLRQANHIQPKLAIMKTVDNPVIDTYVRLKQRYGQDILVETEIFTVQQAEASDALENLNNDAAIHGIIIQLPLADPVQTDELVARIAPQKDVDGMLGAQSRYDPATAVAINWLLAAYNVDLATKQLAIVGQGRLVGEPLARLWQQSGYNVTVFDKDDGKDLAQLVAYDVVVSATGQPGLITSDMLQPGAVAVDAGTTAQGSHIVGDFAASVRERQDILMTPLKGGVGPLTVAALFDNVIRAARTSGSPMSADA